MPLLLQRGEDRAVVRILDRHDAGARRPRRERLREVVDVEGRQLGRGLQVQSELGDGEEGLQGPLVLLVTAFAVVIVFLLQGTQFSWSLGDLGDGMRFQIALGAMGTAVLHPQGIVPKGQEVMTTISSIFGSAIGTWGAVVFLAGAGVACSRRSSPTSPAWAVRSAARWPSSAPSTGMTSTSASAGCG